MKVKLIKKVHLFDYREIKSFKDWFCLGPEHLESKTFEKIVDIQWLKDVPEELRIEEEPTFYRFVDLSLSFPVYKSRLVLFRESYKEECEKSLKDDWREAL
jgi:hypothetical protein